MGLLALLRYFSSGRSTCADASESARMGTLFSVAAASSAIGFHTPRAYGSAPSRRHTAPSHGYFHALGQRDSASR